MCAGTVLVHRSCCNFIVFIVFYFILFHFILFLVFYLSIYYFISFFILFYFFEQAVWNTAHVDQAIKPQFYSQFPGFEGLCKLSNTPQRSQIQGHGFDASFVLVRKEKNSKNRETSQDLATNYIHHYHTANKLKATAQHIPAGKSRLYLTDTVKNSPISLSLN